MSLKLQLYVFCLAGTSWLPGGFLWNIFKKRNGILRDSASSFHWLSSSIFSCCSSSFVPHRWHLLSSPLYDASEHTNHIFSVRIWSWQHVSVNISSVAELSPVYCCLVICIVPKSSRNFEKAAFLPLGWHNSWHSACLFGRRRVNWGLFGCPQLVHSHTLLTSVTVRVPAAVCRRFLKEAAST